MIRWLILSGLDDLKTICDKLFPDWKTMLIQLIATIILCIILAKFLVKPAKNFIRKRREYIQNNLDDAKLKQEEATKKLQEAEQEIKNSKQTSKEIIEEAKISALNEKDKIIFETKKEVQLRKQKAEQEILLQQKQMQEELSKEVVDIAMQAATKVINREINQDDNEKLIEDFLKDEDES